MNTTDEPTYPVVMGRLAGQLRVTQDADLAKALGLSSSDLANRKRRGSIPWERIVGLAATRRVSMDALIVGEGTREDAAGYHVRAPPDCPEYRAAVDGVLGALERAGVRLAAVQVRGLIEFATGRPLRPDELDRLVLLMAPPEAVDKG